MKESRKWAAVEKKAGLGPVESEALRHLIEDAGLLDRLTTAELCEVVKLMRWQKRVGQDEMYRELTSK